MIPRALLYRLGDALELTLELDGDLVRGKRNCGLELAGVPVQVPLDVVASRLFGNDAAPVLLEREGRPRWRRSRRCSTRARR